MQTSTQLAVQTAQSRLDRTTSGYKQDLLDLALDELLRQPNREGDPEHLLGNALANSRKHLRRRRAIASVTAYGDAQDLVTLADAGTVDSLPVLIEALDWLQRARLTQAERTALTEAAVAEFLPGPKGADASAQQRLSRARASARAARLRFSW
jgi:hypothetical protein